MTASSWYRLPDLFDRDLKFLLYSMSLRRIAMGFLEVVRAIYFALLGFSPIEIGLLLSIATLTSAFHHITFGMLSDRLGRKPFLIVGGIFATLRMVIFAVSADFWMLALGQGVGAMGEGAGAGQPVVSGYLADKTELEHRSSLFSTFAVTNGIAATLGSLMAGLLPSFQTWFGLDIVNAHSLLFWIGVIGGIGSILLVLPISDVKPPRNTQDSDPHTLPESHSWGVIARYALIRSTSGVGWGFIQSLLTLYFFIQFGVGGEVLGQIYAGVRFLSLFSYVFVSRVVRWLGEIPTLVLSRFLTASLAVFFPLATTYPVAIILMMAFRVVMMFTMPIRQSFATRIVPSHETATAIGVSNFARMSLRTIAPVIAGYMFEAISLTLPFLTGASLLVVNGLLFRAFFQSPHESDHHTDR
jgi:MFS family permease